MNNLRSAEKFENRGEARKIAEKRGESRSSAEKPATTSLLAMAGFF
jgi:hypothetical protein